MQTIINPSYKIFVQDHLDFPIRKFHSPLPFFLSFIILLHSTYQIRCNAYENFYYRTLLNTVWNARIITAILTIQMRNSLYSNMEALLRYISKFIRIHNITMARLKNSITVESSRDEGVTRKHCNAKYFGTIRNDFFRFVISCYTPAANFRETGFQRTGEGNYGINLTLDEIGSA